MNAPAYIGQKLTLQPAGFLCGRLSREELLFLLCLHLQNRFLGLELCHVHDDADGPFYLAVSNTIPRKSFPGHWQETGAIEPVIDLVFNDDVA